MYRVGRCQRYHHGVNFLPDEEASLINQYCVQRWGWAELIAGSRETPLTRKLTTLVGGVGQGSGSALLARGWALLISGLEGKGGVDEIEIDEVELEFL